MGSNTFSDYGSGSSMNSSTSWGSLNQEQDSWHSLQSRLRSSDRPQKSSQKSSSFADLVMGRYTLEDVMQDFRMNGSDSPYNPDEDRIWTHKPGGLVGMGPSNVYLRQKSWPAPERSPAARLPRPRSEWLPAGDHEYTLTPRAAEAPATQPQPAADLLTEEQRRVLSSLPDTTVYALLREMEMKRNPERRANKRLPNECRFCKNNGERESYYRSHTLKDARGRVACPVLRAFRCARCGAAGDRAHTIKYCPLSTVEERLKSAAMMRSVRLASGRRRAPPGGGAAHHVVFNDDDAILYAPLDPLWAALEEKLML